MSAVGEEHYTAGQAADIAGTTRRAIRIYETKGLLPTPARTGAGYRLFTVEDIEALKFIRQARTLGLSLDEVKEILDLQRGGTRPCAYVIRLLDAHLAQVQKTLKELLQLQDTLRSARQTADQVPLTGGGTVICRIVKTPQPGVRTTLPLRPKPATPAWHH